MHGRIHFFWVILAVLCAAAALIACIYAGLFGQIYNQPGGSPQETVVRFFDSLKNGDYTAAYDCLGDYNTLGLETEPDSEEARQILQALRTSYGYTLKGECSVDGLNAEQTVHFRYLSIRKTEDAVASRVNTVLEEKIAELPQEEVYADGGGYQTGLTDLVYAETLSTVLRNVDGVAAETDLEIHLQYLDGTWKIITDRSLMSALIGGEM